jgi:hypothetical protein
MVELLHYSPFKIDAIPGRVADFVDKDVLGTTEQAVIHLAVG